MSTELANCTAMNENMFAFISGFATKMPDLSQEIYPLDLRNIATLTVKLKLYAPSRFEPTFSNKLKEVENEVFSFIARTENQGDWNEYWTYMATFLQDFRDSVPNLDFYDFNRGTHIDNSVASKENRPNQLGVTGFRKHYEHPKYLQDALRNLNELTAEYSSDYHQNSVYQLGVKLAECYKNDEISYPESLKAYCFDFSALLPTSSRLQQYCTETGSNVFKEWKEHVIRAVEEWGGSSLGFCIDFEEVPMLKTTWAVFEESVNILQNTCTHSKGLSSSRSIPREDLVSVNELIKASKCDAVKHGISKNTIKNILKKAGIVEYTTEKINRSYHGLFPRAESERAIKEWREKR